MPPTVFPPDLATRLEPIHAEVPSLDGFEPAAVLATILSGEGEDRVLLIERPRSLNVHGGQLAFPGGKREPGDRDLLMTALRESHEEVGLDAHDVQVLGRLEPVPTPSRFFIVPFVGRVTPGWVPTPNPAEVAAIVTPSVATLCDPSIHHVGDVRRWRGIDYKLHEFSIHEPPLWGATARMVWELLERSGFVS